MPDSSHPALARDSSILPPSHHHALSTDASRPSAAHETRRALTSSASLSAQNDEKTPVQQPDVSFVDAARHGGQDMDEPGAKARAGPPASTPSLAAQAAADATSSKENSNITPEHASLKDGAVDDAAAGAPESRFQRIMAETRRSFWLVVTHTWLNVLLLFVPVGIVVGQFDGIHGGVVFAMNCISVIPLAGLLAFATESVAAEMGDALGALLNVTFGNAVELIIFIIALTQDKIRIVQASLLGSILANLLLILGMGFFLGGLRYREQIYNSTVTQMSACLLSLSVISLVLPTAFHASFSDPRKADAESLKISRGTSVILLLVYGIYLLFQLKSHAYLYESTPQHIVDAEAQPGPAAGWLDSSSSDDSSSSSDSDSSDSDHSRDTMKRKMKKVLRGGRRRKSSAGSADTDKMNAFRNRSASFLSVGTNGTDENVSETSSSTRRAQKAVVTAEDDSSDDDRSYKRHFRRHKHRRHRRKQRRHRKDREEETAQVGKAEQHAATQAGPDGEGEPRRVDFAVQTPPKETAAAHDEGNATAANNSRRPFPALRGMSVKNLAPTVFVQKPEAGDSAGVAASSGPVPRVRYGIRRTNSLPDRISHQHQQQYLRPPGGMLPAQVPLAALTGGTGAQDAAKEVDNGRLTKWASVVLLLLTTGLVAYCAELLISSIEDVTENSSVGEIFIGLIILPIVGNAAEHVTAITVAMKNKMDLAIGVAVGSSIQIAIFITPLVVVLGWIMDKEMTLYFTLFETVCLFVSAFMVNFLVLDGRSNFLEGALLCAVYLIISVVAFFYPDADEASQWGE